MIPADLQEVIENPEKYIDLAKKKPVVIHQQSQPMSVLISYDIYKTLLESAWAENALKYSGATKEAETKTGSNPETKAESGE